VRVLGYATVGDYLRRRCLTDRASLDALERNWAPAGKHSPA